ncbi:MAG: hypothetical protein GFH27_549313n105 [Chloroflexi bacterium AL-W]|nr:hypothetical protein [Chloroflexi bacterium AL-N1]NOK69528.1 hypothetical protein [Chloroflexi bacterium AL-N10]NOK77493.1 hypothetical protein [Chloroflexi bacterium AL-N5]NOK84344.1 hypothetical protein [Chloroflexi bacterium AL-W]NOK91490.1 hypothetical protein [Chloroflexi bacterium AL-N15]
MRRPGRHKNTTQQKTDVSEPLTRVDRWTKALAISTSRRRFLNTLAAGGAILGLTQMKIRPVYAVDCTEDCSGSCTCSTESVTCCSPNGVYCYSKTCTLTKGCQGIIGPKLGVRPYIRPCDDGTRAHGCNACFA